MDAWSTRARMVSLAVLVLLAACTRATPEARLRETLSDLQQAIESRDAGELRGELADDFIGPDGLDKAGAARLAQGMFLRYRDVGVHTGPFDVTVQGTHATVRCDAMLTGGEGLLPEAGQLYTVTTGWRLDGGEWRLVAAEWKVAGSRQAAQ
ncbi:MAG: nuclear transport factor 2 family protein [Lysobacter sp.]|nr:nuclear transport factor 2 family protein [Lysobacter sp.]